MQKSFLPYVIFAICILFLISCSQKDEIIIYELTQEQKNVLKNIPQPSIIAHRGTCYWAPEGTEAAMRWARNAGATEVICQPFEDALDQIEGDKDTYFVVLTRGHRYDQVCLEKIVGKEHAYIGMIGSRRRSAMVKQNLIEKGCSQEVIGEIKSPIGLNIGAETPEEIGVAIMAEIIEVKNQNKRVCGYPEDLLEAILDIVHPGKKMLATIITRKGSAPRNVGSKMLILEDGSCVGTIGGGCMEAEVLRKARVMMHENNTGLKTEYVDMTGDDAEEDGMVCGGTIEVLLEPLWN